MEELVISEEIRRIIEDNSVAIATVTKDGNPNVIGVAYVKVVGNDKLLVTDNFMSQTVIDIKNNPKVCVLGWNSEMVGFKLLGRAEYFDSGEWLMKVKSLKGNDGMPAKGALLITVERIIKSA